MATYDYYYNQNKKYADEQYAKTSAENKSATEKYINDVKSSYDPAISSAKANADTQTQGLNQQFQKDFDYQAVQELVNKRKLAESMANQGLTDSGLNRTQQTALAVTRSNNEGALTQQKNTQSRQIQQSLDNYLNGVNSTIAQTSANAYANLSEKNQNVYNSIYNALSDNATSLAKADTAAEAARYKAEQEAAAAVYKAQLAAEKSNKISSTLTKDAEEQYANGGENGLTSYLRKQMAYGNLTDDQAIAISEGIVNNASSSGDTFVGTTYEEAVKYIQSHGVDNATASGIRTESEWKHRKGEYSTYQEYLNSATSR